MAAAAVALSAAAAAVVALLVTGRYASLQTHFDTSISV